MLPLFKEQKRSEKTQDGVVIAVRSMLVLGFCLTVWQLFRGKQDAIGEWPDTLVAPITEVYHLNYYTMKSNLVKDEKFRHGVKHSSSGPNSFVMIHPLIKPRDFVNSDNNEEELQLYVDKASFRHSDQQTETLVCTSRKPSINDFVKDERYAINVDARSIGSGRKKLNRDIFVTLLAAWSRWADEKQYPYWIAHGNLLGWFWDRKMMNWDFTLEVHVPANLLYDLSTYDGLLIMNQVHCIIYILSFF